MNFEQATWHEGCVGGERIVPLPSLLDQADERG